MYRPALLLVLLSAACRGTEYAVAPIEEPRVRTEAPEAESGPVAVPRGSAAVEAERDVERGLRVDRFEFGDGATTPVVDFLFVLDNSTSMNALLERVRAAFASLAASGAFPPDARVAVMNPIPGDYDRLGHLHPAVRPSPGLARHPGFLRLVDRAGIERYRGSRGKAAARGVTEGGGCGAWFAPAEKDALGTPCLVAHTSLPTLPFRAEAGLHALRQVLQMHPDGGFFRDGAAVNVVFVSDTHDPGFRPLRAELQAAHDDLVRDRPTLAELKDLAAVGHALASFRVHAIAPERACTDEPVDLEDLAYFDVAEEASGVTADICTTDDYAPIVRSIAAEGAAVETPVFPLGSIQGDVTAVLVDGYPVPYALSPAGTAVVVDEGAVRGPARVDVVRRTHPIRARR